MRVYATEPNPGSLTEISDTSQPGDPLFVSEPVTGHNHGMTALTETAGILAAADSGIGDKGYQGAGFITPFKKPQGGELHDWQKEFNAQVNRLRAPVERAIAHLKSWRILHIDYRRPLRTWRPRAHALIAMLLTERLVAASAPSRPAGSAGTRLRTVG